jgi:chemotaxis signal transduction protein
MHQGTDLAVIFELGGESYALPAAHVERVIELGPLACLPRLHVAVRGITHHRGRIVTVADLAALVRGVPTPLPDPRCRLLVVEREGPPVGLLCGPVSGITALNPAGGSAPPRDGGYVVRVHMHEGRVVNVLSMEKVVEQVQGLCRAQPATVPPPTPATAAVQANP